LALYSVLVSAGLTEEALGDFFVPSRMTLLSCVYYGHGEQNIPPGDEIQKFGSAEQRVSRLCLEQEVYDSHLCRILRVTYVPLEASLSALKACVDNPLPSSDLPGAMRGLMTQPPLAGSRAVVAAYKQAHLSLHLMSILSDLLLSFPRFFGAEAGFTLVTPQDMLDTVSDLLDVVTKLAGAAERRGGDGGQAARENPVWAGLLCRRRQRENTTSDDGQNSTPPQILSQFPAQFLEALYAYSACLASRTRSRTGTMRYTLPPQLLFSTIAMSAQLFTIYDCLSLSETNRQFLEKRRSDWESGKSPGFLGLLAGLEREAKRSTRLSIEEKRARIDDHSLMLGGNQLAALITDHSSAQGFDDWSGHDEDRGNTFCYKLIERNPPIPLVFYRAERFLGWASLLRRMSEIYCSSLCQNTFSGNSLRRGRATFGWAKFGRVRRLSFLEAPESVVENEGVDVWALPETSCCRVRLALVSSLLNHFNAPLAKQEEVIGAHRYYRPADDRSTELSLGRLTLAYMEGSGITSFKELEREFNDLHVESKVDRLADLVIRKTSGVVKASVARSCSVRHPATEARALLRGARNAAKGFFADLQTILRERRTYSLLLDATNRLSASGEGQSAAERQRRSLGEMLSTSLTMTPFSELLCGRTSTALPEWYQRELLFRSAYRAAGGLYARQIVSHVGLYAALPSERDAFEPARAGDRLPTAAMGFDLPCRDAVEFASIVHRTSQRCMSYYINMEEGCGVPEKAMGGTRPPGREQDQQPDACVSPISVGAEDDSRSESDTSLAGAEQELQGLVWPPIVRDEKGFPILLTPLITRDASKSLSAIFLAPWATTESEHAPACEPRRHGKYVSHCDVLLESMRDLTSELVTAQRPSWLAEKMCPVGDSRLLECCGRPASPGEMPVSQVCHNICHRISELDKLGTSPHISSASLGRALTDFSHVSSAARLICRNGIRTLFIEHRVADVSGHYTLDPTRDTGIQLLNGMEFRDMQETLDPEKRLASSLPQDPDSGRIPAAPRLTLLAGFFRGRRIRLDRDALGRLLGEVFETRDVD